MSFRSLAIAEGRNGWVLDGELTIGDVTLSQRLDVEFGGIEDFALGSRHAGFEATGESCGARTSGSIWRSHRA